MFIFKDSNSKKSLINCHHHSSSLVPQLAWRHEPGSWLQNPYMDMWGYDTWTRALSFLVPFFPLLLWSCLLWSETNVLALEQDCRGCPQASASWGWVTDPNSPSTNSPSQRPDSSYSATSLFLLPPCHLPPFVYLSDHFFSLSKPGLS